MAFNFKTIERRRDERNAKMAFKAFAVAVALVLLTAGILVGLFFTRWNVRTLSPAGVQKVVADFKVKNVKGALFSVCQYSDGTKELCLPPNFIAPADAATLAILAENGIHYRTLVQGRDFGYGSPKQGVALLIISLLVGGAGIILWRVSHKALAAVVALVLVAVGTLMGLRTTWHAQSTFDRGRPDHDRGTPGRAIPDYRIQQWFQGVVDYSAREQVLSPLYRNGGRFHARPAGRNKIEFHTSFGYGVPRRGTALLYISILAAGAVAILWWAWKRKRPLPATAESSH